MKITRTSANKRVKTITLVEGEPDWPRNWGAGNPRFFDLPIHVGLDTDKDGRWVELRMSVEEAERLAAKVLECVAKAKQVLADNPTSPTT